MPKNNEYTHGLARRGTPNLYLGARLFEPEEKFRAFLAAYAAMRLVDDIVDDSRASGALNEALKDKLHSHLDGFAEMIRRGHIDDELPYAKELQLSWRLFQIPPEPFIRLVEAMKFDLENDRFDTHDDFLKYSEGAAVAPGSIFMHLAGSSFNDSNQLIPPRFDIHETARPLAVFSYLVHILRDFKKDFTSGRQPLIYFDTATLGRFNISENDLARIAATGVQSPKFTEMIQWYHDRAADYQRQSEKMLATISPELPPDGRLALNFVYELYTRTRNIIAESDFQVASAAINLTESDIAGCARLAASRSGIAHESVLDRISEILDEKKI